MKRHTKKQLQALTEQLRKLQPDAADINAEIVYDDDSGWHWDGEDFERFDVPEETPQ